MRNNINKIILLGLVFSINCQSKNSLPQFSDFKKFPNSIIKKSDFPFIFKTLPIYKNPKNITNNLSFERYLKKNGTYAFLIIRNDTIQYEKYFKGYDKTSMMNSFSIAKSITSILIGCAIDDKIIASVEEPITNYIPELKKNGFENIRIKNLLQMTSGIKFDEIYDNPQSDALKMYYSKDLRKILLDLKIGIEVGKEFEYVSVNSQLLGLILERALKTKTVSQYLQERLWQPLGMEFDANWSVDNQERSMEKTFCCLNARARDFAKIGRLYLNNGNWNGTQIVSKNWVEKSMKIDTTNGSAWNYQYNWWLPTKSGDFMAEGHLGQFIYLNPSKNIIIIRFGNRDGDITWWLQFLTLMAEY